MAPPGPGPKLALPKLATRVRVPRTLWLLALAMLVTLAVPGRYRARLGLGSTMLCVLLWAACTGGGTADPGRNVSRNGGTPSGTYNLTITGTSGSLTHSVTVGLTVN